jgi:hypothetical protein
MFHTHTEPFPAGWHKRAVCPRCGWSFWLPIGRHIQLGQPGDLICEGCGRPRDDTWAIVTAILARRGIWWKPWTWCLSDVWLTQDSDGKLHGLPK